MKQEESVSGLKSLILGDEVEGELARSDKHRSRSLSEESILEESEYNRRMSEIIKRDYYPDLYRLEAYEEYIEKGKGRVPPTALLRQTPRETPGERRIDPFRDLAMLTSRHKGGGAYGATLTPSHNNIHGRVTTHNQRITPPHQTTSPLLTLDSFLHKYTSQDNHSFELIHHADRQRHKEKYAWIYTSAQRANSKLLPIQGEGPTKAIQEGGKALQISYIDPKSSFYFRGGKEGEVTKSLEIDHDLIAPPKEIKKQNTRIPSSLVLKQLKYEKEGNKQGRTGEVDLERYLDQERKTEEHISLDGLRDLRENKQRKLDTPVVRGYKLLKEEGIGVAESPMITWGQIAGEPLLLNPPHNPFKIPETPIREQLGLDMANKQQVRRSREEVRRNKRKRQPRTPIQGGESYLKQIDDISSSARKLLGSRGIKRNNSIFHTSHHPGSTTPLKRRKL